MTMDQIWNYCPNCVAGSAFPAYNSCAICGMEAEHLTKVNGDQLREHLESGRRANARALRIHRVIAGPAGLVAHG